MVFVVIGLLFALPSSPVTSNRAIISLESDWRQDAVLETLELLPSEHFCDDCTLNSRCGLPCWI